MSLDGNVDLSVLNIISSSDIQGIFTACNNVALSKCTNYETFHDIANSTRNEHESLLPELKNDAHIPKYSWISVIRLICNKKLFSYEIR